MPSMDMVTALAQAGPLGVGSIALAEKLLPIVPSYAVFVIVGMMIAASAGDLMTTVIAAALGSTIGALCWYGLGAALGSRRSEVMVRKLGPYVFLKLSLYERMSEAYRRNHFWVTAIGQTVPVVRVYLSIPAGVLNLAIVEFTAATLFGSMAWCGPLIAFVYVMAKQGADPMSSGPIVVLTLVCLEFIAIFGWRARRRRKRL